MNNIVVAVRTAMAQPGFLKFNPPLEEQLKNDYKCIYFDIDTTVVLKSSITWQGCSKISSRNAKTFDQAFRLARRIPTGQVLITQTCWKKGHRYIREYWYRRVDR